MHQCKGEFDHLYSLLTHCKSMGGVYHASFRAYGKAMTLWDQQWVPATGNIKTGRITGVPEDECASVAGRGTNSNVEDTNADLGRPSSSADLASDARVQHE